MFKTELSILFEKRIMFKVLCILLENRIMFLLEKRVMLKVELSILLEDCIMFKVELCIPRCILLRNRIILR